MEQLNLLSDENPSATGKLKQCLTREYCKLTILQCYAPVNEAQEDKEDWFVQLQQTVSKVSQHDMLLINGDTNTKVGLTTPTTRVLWDNMVVLWDNMVVVTSVITKKDWQSCV